MDKISSKTWIRRFSFRPMSIRQRLPLLICILLLLVIVTFSWSSYIGVKRASLVRGKERIQSLTEQLSSMFGQSAQTLVATTRTASANGSIKEYLLSAKPQSDSDALIALQKLRPDSTWVLTELLNEKRQSVLQSGFQNVEINVNRDSLISLLSIGADSCKIGRFFFVKDSIYYPVIAAITEKKQAIGYLIRWKLQKATAKAVAQLSQLLGGNATLYVGNADGSFWSDMNSIVPSPPVDLQQVNNFIEYSPPKSNRVIATARPIPYTPWLVLIEASKQKMLEAANRFLNWIIIIGTILIAIGIFLAWLMSRSITRPLKNLTAAASAIANGDYSASVEVDRSDELGKLARAFNAMIAQVSAAQKNLEKRAAELEASNAELERFAYVASHDLQEPLRMVSNFMQLLEKKLEGTLDPTAKQYMHFAVDGADRMKKLIEDLLEYSRVGTNKDVVEVVDCNKVIETIRKLFYVAIREKNAVLDVKQLPSLRGIKTQLMQLFQNLIGNALKYSKNGSCKIEVGCNEVNNAWQFYIKDNGIGIDPQYFGRIFVLFQRLHNKNEYSGTGMGLAICKKIVEKHGGKIWLESKLDEGSTFYLTFPKTS